MLGQRAVDRFKNNAYDIIDGKSYRARPRGEKSTAVLFSLVLAGVPPIHSGPSQALEQERAYCCHCRRQHINPLGPLDASASAGFLIQQAILAHRTEARRHRRRVPMKPWKAS